MNLSTTQKRMLLAIFTCLVLVACAGKPPTVTATASPSTTPLPSAQAVDLGVLGKGSARDMAWSPDDALLAVTSSTGVYVYDAQSWQVTKTIRQSTFGDKSVNALAFSRDGKSLILLVYTYMISSFWRYDLQSGQAAAWLADAAVDPQTAPVFSPDGKTFAFLNRVCKNDGSSCSLGLELRESATGFLVHSLRQIEYGQQNQINIFAFSPDGKQLAAGGADNRVAVWDTASGALRYEFHHDSQVASLDFSPDARLLVSTGKDATVRFWDLQTGQSLSVLRGFKRGLQYVAYLDNGKKLLVGGLVDNVLQEYAVDERHLSGNPLAIFIDPGEDLDKYQQADATTTANIKLSPATDKIAILLNQRIQIWDTGTGKLVLALPEYNGPISILAFSPDGNLLALADHDVHLWRISDREFITALGIAEDKIEDLVFRPVGSQLAFTSAGGNVEIWDTISIRKLRDINSGCPAIRLAYSPDGKKLATLSWCDLKIWNADSGDLEQKWAIESAEPRQLSFSADGSHLFTITENERAGWDVTTGKNIYTIKPENNGYYGSAALNASLGLVWSRNAPLYFFDPITGQHLYDFANHSEETLAALSPNGRLLAWQDKGKINLVDSASGENLLSVDTRNFSSFFFRSDNRLLASVTGDQTVHLWDISSAAKKIEATSPLTATPAPTISPTPTRSPQPVAPLSIPTRRPPTPQPGFIRPENISQLEKRIELGFGEVQVAAWAPDGKTLAVAVPYGVYIVEPGVAQPVRFLPADEYDVSSSFYPELLAFSRDGRLLAAQMSNVAIEVWDVTTSHSLYRLDAGSCWNRGMLFSPDNQVLSAYCGDGTRRWSLSDGQMLSKDAQNVFDPDTNPDGSLRIQSSMTAMNLLDSGSGTIIKTFDMPDMAPALAKFSPDGKTLLVWFYKFDVARTGIYIPALDPQSLVQLWNITPGHVPSLRTSFTPGKWHPQSIAILGAFDGLAFSPDSRRVVTASGDGQVQVWDVRSGKLLATLPDGGKVYLSPDGKRLITLGKGLRVWDISPGKPPAILWNVPGFTDYADQLTFSADGKQLSIASADIFRNWSRNGTTFAEYPSVIEVPETNTNRLLVSPDGKRLVYSSLEKLVLGENNPTAPNWRTIETFADVPYKLEARALAFSPDSSFLAVADPDRKVLLWRLERPQDAAVELASNVYIANLLFSPDGSLLLGWNGISSEESDLYLWDTASGKLLRTWKMTGEPFAFGPDGVTLATANDQNGTISLFDLRDWSLLREMKGLPNIRAMTFNPDGSLLVSVYEEKIEFWEIATGNASINSARRLLRTLDGHFNRLAFSPDGKLLAVGLQEGRIEIWRLPGECVDRPCP